MNIDIILFFILALSAAVSAVGMITRPNPVMSAIFLIFNFFALAGLYLLLRAQFISVVQIIVYAGAIMVLFLFVLMLLNTKSEFVIFTSSKRIKILSIIIAALVFVQLGYILFSSSVGDEIPGNFSLSEKIGTIENIGKSIYTTYVIPFLASGFLLLAATIGALILAKKKFEQNNL